MTASTVRIDPKWNLLFDTQINTGNKFRQIETILLRPGLMYRINNNLSVAGGYALFDNRKTYAGNSGMLVENRLWEQVQLNTRTSSYKWTHRLRFEQRWVPQPAIENNGLKKDGSNLSNRLRYFTRFTGPLSARGKTKNISYWTMQQEIFLNIAGAAYANKKFLDQIRPVVGMGVHLNKNADIELQYMGMYVQLANDSYRINNAVRIMAFFHL